MKILLPQNIFAALFGLACPESLKADLSVKNAGLIYSALMEEDYDVALIPSLDIIKNEQLFVSGKYGISFDGPLSNSFIYFSEKETETFSDLYLRGDLSVNEFLLIKVLFKERFNKDVNLIADSQELLIGERNYLISGNENFLNSKLFSKGISFADIFSEVLNFPYVNFIFVSQKEEILKEFNSLLDNINEKIAHNLTEYLEMIGVNEELKVFILENNDSVYYDFTENEEIGLTEVTRLPFYYGLTEEIAEIKFIK